jgi:hypothetical protein
LERYVLILTWAGLVIVVVFVVVLCAHFISVGTLAIRSRLDGAILISSYALMIAAIPESQLKAPFLAIPLTWVIGALGLKWFLARNNKKSRR